MTSNLIEDLSILTTIPTKNLTSLFNKMEYCIVDTVKENYLQNNDLTEIDIGFGKLYIKKEENNLRYKFTPSDELTKALSNLFKNKLNLLEFQLEKSLVDKITNVYKELL